MNINWIIIIITGGLAAGLIVFLVIRNMKDEQELEHQLNEEFDIPEKHDENSDPEDAGIG